MMKTLGLEQSPGKARWGKLSLFVKTHKVSYRRSKETWLDPRQKSTTFGVVERGRNHLEDFERKVCTDSEIESHISEEIPGFLSNGSSQICFCWANERVRLGNWHDMNSVHYCKVHNDLYSGVMHFTARSGLDIWSADHFQVETQKTRTEGKQKLLFLNFE